MSSWWIVKALDYGILVHEFEFHSRYYVHFRTNTLGESYEPPDHPSYELDSITAVFLVRWL